MRFELLTFDLDGTLVDTAAEIAEAANRSLVDISLPRQSEAMVTRLIGGGAHALMRALLDRMEAEGRAVPVSVDRDAVLRAFDAHYLAVAGSVCRPYPFAVDALQRLKDAGLRLACVTNKEARFSAPVLAACGMTRFFDMVVSGDTLAAKKPDGRVIGHVVETLGASRETTAHVGDSRIDVATARNAGVAAWAVPYGYDGGTPVSLAEPDRLFDDLSQVARYVLD